jgi:hypothetical protein
MRKLITNKNPLVIVSVFLLMTSVNAQELTVRVPQDQPNVRDAMFYIKGQTAVMDALILIDEGDILTTAGFGNFDRAIKITFQGAGADKSFIRGFTDEEAMPAPSEGGGRRFLQMNNAANAGTELIFKDLSFVRWGFGDGNGGAIVNIVGQNITLSFINCNFEQLQAEKGAIMQSSNGENTVTFQNCFIGGGSSFDRGAMNGMIYKKGGTLIISNTTFMSNTRYTATTGTESNLDRGAKKAGVISLESSAAAKLIFVLEACMFVNNQTAPAGIDTVQPMISFYPLDGVMEVAMSGNIMLGNLREGKAEDADLYIADIDKITWDNSGNVLNRAIKRVVDGETESFIAAEIPGCDINELYHYTHVDIGFTMDGALPKLFTDEFGVKHLGFADPSNVNFQNYENSISVYPNPSQGIFEIRLEGTNQARYEIYNAIGNLVKSGNLNDATNTFDITNSGKGLYILRINSENKEYIQKIMVR